MRTSSESLNQLHLWAPAVRSRCSSSLAWPANASGREGKVCWSPQGNPAGMKTLKNSGTFLNDSTFWQKLLTFRTWLLHAVAGMERQEPLQLLPAVHYPYYSSLFFIADDCRLSLLQLSQLSFARVPGSGVCRKSHCLSSLSGLSLRTCY